MVNNIICYPLIKNLSTLSFVNVCLHILYYTMKFDFCSYKSDYSNIFIDNWGFNFHRLHQAQLTVASTIQLKNGLYIVLLESLDLFSSFFQLLVQCLVASKVAILSGNSRNTIVHFLACLECSTVYLSCRHVIYSLHKCPNGPCSLMTHIPFLYFMCYTLFFFFFKTKFNYKIDCTLELP